MIVPTYIRSIINAFLLTILTGGFGLTSFAQKFEAEAYTDTNKILIGDHVKLTLILTHDFKKEILWPVIGDTITEKIEVIDQTKSDTIKRRGDGSIEISRTFTITSFDSGFFVIPPFKFVQADDLSVITETEAILIEVQTLEVDTTEAFKDIKNPYDVPYTWDEYIPEALITLGALVGLILLYFSMRYLKNRPKKELGDTVIKRDPGDVAIEELKKLEKKKLWQQDKIKEFYTELTDIIRKYVEYRYGIIAMEMTTDEILDSMIYVQVHVSVREKLGQLLLMADMVKFAKSKPIASEHEISMERAYNFVGETKQISDSGDTQEGKNQSGEDV